MNKGYLITELLLLLLLMSLWLLLVLPKRGSETIANTYLCVCPHLYIFALKMFFSATACPINVKLQKQEGLPMENILFLTLTSQVTWYGSHIGLKEKIGHPFLRNCSTKNIKTWHMSSTPHGLYRVMPSTSSMKWYSSHNWLN